MVVSLGLTTMGLQFFCPLVGSALGIEYDQEPVGIAKEGKMPWDVTGNEFK